MGQKNAMVKDNNALKKYICCDWGAERVVVVGSKVGKDYNCGKPFMPH